MFKNAEDLVRMALEWLRLGIETLSATVIAFGIGLAIVGLARHLFTERGKGFIPVRLAFARYLTLALEFQLAADILSTAIAPTWDQIGKLVAIAVIRTALNYFLNNEMDSERSRQDSNQTADPDQPDRGRARK